MFKLLRQGVPARLRDSRFLSSLTTTKVSNITIIYLSRPDKVNALDLATLKALTESIEVFEADKNSPCAVLCGQGGDFCSGFDLHELLKNMDSDIFDKFREFLLRPAKKPVIAAVNGYAVGQGVDLALWCDLRFIEDNAVIGFFNKRFDVPTCDVTIRRLEKMIGTSRTMDMVLHGQSVTARQALDWGFCNKMVTPGTAIGEAVDKAIKLSNFSQESLLADRATLLHNFFSNMNENVPASNQNINKLPFEKSKHLIEQFVRKEFGRHGAFKNVRNCDGLEFLEN